MTDPCPICHGRGTITEQSAYSYARCDVTRPCDCQPADPWRPAETQSEIDDYIAARRAAEREHYHDVA